MIKLNHLILGNIFRSGLLFSVKKVGLHRLSSRAKESLSCIRCSGFSNSVLMRFLSSLPCFFVLSYPKYRTSITCSRWRLFGRAWISYRQSPLISVLNFSLPSNTFGKLRIEGLISRFSCIGILSLSKMLFRSILLPYILFLKISFWKRLGDAPFISLMSNLSWLVSSLGV